MSKSILQDKKECWACHTRFNLHEHHCLYGTADRKKAEQYGLKVWLCVEHHTGIKGVHNGNRKLDTELKQLAQREFEKIHGHEMFMNTFHRNYL